MAEFNPITSQEDLDKIIGSRLQRERETVSKEFAAQIAERDQKITDFESQVNSLTEKYNLANEKASKVDELESRVKVYEANSVKMRIAHEYNLPYELAERLQGETEEAIKADAENLQKFIGSKQPASPAKNTETDGNKTGTAGAWAGMLQSMKGE